MKRTLTWTTLALLGCAACSDAPGDGASASATPETSELTLQAVDAGTGDALADQELTVRYLVRSPLTLDEAASDEVPAASSYTISHLISADSLVVEVRLEAPSYYRLDTVLSVARGSSAGPYTIRMARQLDRMATAGSAPSTRVESPAPPRSDAASPTSADPSAGGGGAASPDAAVDRAPLRAGDRAFAAGDWVAATAAYERMPAPSDPSSEYASSYQAALTRQGISHINLGEWGSALDPLERAAELGSAGAMTYFHLGRAQCAVGRLGEGRRSLEQVTPLSSTIRPDERAEVVALSDYHRALCSQREFERAESSADVVRTGARTVQELEAFVAAGEGVVSPSSELSAALEDARGRIRDVRTRLLTLGRN